MVAATPSPQLADLLGHLAAFRARGGRMLGLAGAPGSGKSTVAEALAATVDGAVVLPMDGFHLADEELARLGLDHCKGAPDTFDVHGFVAALRRTRERAADVLVPRFDRHLEAAIAGAIRVGVGAPLVIVEGNYLLLDRPGWVDVRATLDECWLLAPDPVVRRRRLVDRHIAHGRSPADAEAWVAAVDEPNAVLIGRTARAAHLVVDPG